MTWQLLKKHSNPLQNSITLKNTDKTSTPTTDYQKSDAIARKLLTKAELSHKGYTAFGTPIRVYVSQAY